MLTSCCSDDDDDNNNDDDNMDLKIWGQEGQDELHNCNLPNESRGLNSPVSN